MFPYKKQKTTAISFNMVPKNGNYISTRIILFLGANVMQGMMCPCIIGWASKEKRKKNNYFLEFLGLKGFLGLFEFSTYDL